jgi:hypothetical protein
MFEISSRTLSFLDLPEHLWTLQREALIASLNEHLVSTNSGLFVNQEKRNFILFVQLLPLANINLSQLGIENPRNQVHVTYTEEPPRFKYEIVTSLVPFFGIGRETAIAVGSQFGLSEAILPPGGLQYSLAADGKVLENGMPYIDM